MKPSWCEKAWEEYLEWQKKDKAILNRINSLIKDIQRNGHNGIGKPEALQGNLSGWWSRRIDDKNRLVYKLEAGLVIVFACKGHYDD